MITRHCDSAGRLFAAFFLSLLAFSGGAVATIDGQQLQSPLLPVLPPEAHPKESELPHRSSELDFRLRHIFHHGTSQYPELHRRLDIKPDASVWVSEDDSISQRQPVPSLRVRARSMQIQRLADRRHDTIDAILDYGRDHGTPMPLDSSDWTVDEIVGPNTTDKETVLSFAKMAQDAYVEHPEDPEWLDVGHGFNYTEHFGWETDGLRGHIFADTENATIVISLKGTSPAVFDGAETTTNDKINDNLFFGCCCGQGGQWGWKQVCDCKTSTYTCNSTCLVQALKEKNRYYYAAQDLYRNVTEMYPDSDVWIAGHSLGGSTGSLLALTMGLPVVTFEAPGDALPAARLGLPTPPDYHIGAHQQRDYTGGYHFGHTADPIFMGTCNAATSVCTLGGYAMQSVCHTGHSCIYDTVGDFGWRAGVGYHRIMSVITDVVAKYDQPANCTQDRGCGDCFNWKFFESNGTETTTTSSATSTSASTSTSRTRTQTCKTPGWWGCLDESTTSRTTITSTTTTTDCATPGWFGCKDGLTTETQTTTITSPPVPPPTTAPSTTAPATSKSAMTSSTSCHTPGRFWGCADPTSTTTTSKESTSTSQGDETKSRLGAAGAWNWRSEI
ncbi:MAG: putative lipase atg15 [Bathelium mastoideum]|nr:MAG: putative lipase atg15 [Bathelium mastoideum]